MSAEGRLTEYRDRRRAPTPEPAGERSADGDDDADRPRFVIQQHDATRLHWDLRLEHDGVLVSWALPRGLPWTPAQNHLAVHTEDHPLEYLDFSGHIPEGSYGGGDMTIWDRGWYEVHEFGDTKVNVTLHGERANGRHALFRTRGRDWMIHRMDPPEDPDRRPVPADLRPMLAVEGTLPADEAAYAFEVRWSGLRVLATSSGGVVTMADADGEDRSAQFPEVRRMGRAIGSTEVVLDGVLVAGSDGGSLADRLGVTSDQAARRHASRNPVTLQAFDVLWRDGHPTIGLVWRERRRLLEDLSLDGPAWQAPTAHEGDGAALLEAAGARGLGLVAKRLESPYRPGVRSEDWIAIGG
jgi:bifunctional non-homologous end joining protein LigD